MVEIKNSEVHDISSKENKKFLYNKGFVVIRTYERSENNLNPIIHICKANRDCPIEIGSGDVSVKDPSQVYSFLLKPEWEASDREKNSAFFILKQSLKPLCREEYLDMIVLNKDIAENYQDSKIIPNTNTSYRDSTIFSVINLEETIKSTIKEKNDHKNIFKHPLGIEYEFDTKHTEQINHFSEKAADMVYKG